MQITALKVGRHGFANAGLALLLAFGWAWFITSPLSTVSAATEQDGPGAIVQGKANQSSSRPHAQGEDVQAQAGEEAAVQAGLPEPTTLHNFVATAYCVKGPTASGLRVRSGIIAADPRILPLGSIVRVIAEGYSGVYTVLDTGPLVYGRKIDIFMPKPGDAQAFGRRKIKLEIIRYGWEPTAGGTVVAELHP